MTIIRCLECNNHVSTLAFTCPHCGAQISKELTQGQSHTTIQGIRKRLKFQFLLSSIMFWGGVCLFATAQTPNNLKLSLVPLTSGAIWFILAKSVDWWHHA